MCRRGDIYYVDFGKTVGSKQSGIRPALVVSNNRANRNSPVITVIPLTTKVMKKVHLPTHVQIRAAGLPRPSMALAEQVESLDKCSLKEKIGEVTDSEVMEKVTAALQIQIGVFEQYN